MQRNVSLEQLNEIIKCTKTYFDVNNAYSLINTCCTYTNQLHGEIQHKTQCIRVSVNKSAHWFLLCNTSDHGVVMIDPTYKQTLHTDEDAPVIFVGKREDLWLLADEIGKSIEWFNKEWPVNGSVIYAAEDLYNEEMKKIFDTDEFNRVKIGNDIKVNSQDDWELITNAFTALQDKSTNQSMLFTQKANRDKPVKVEKPQHKNSVFCCFGSK